jgi:hypothetical protein
MEPAMTLRGIRTMESILHESLASNRWSFIVLGSFAAVAVVMGG